MGAILLLILALTSPAFGQGAVTLDGSFGTSGALTGPNFQITAGMGRQVGNNLFHSFGTFNLVSGESATFSGPANIQNILARVTGGSPSSIDGTIGSSIAGANLFFLNPNGVIFGPNAQINVTGSFAVSTADYVKTAGGGIFYTSLGGADVLSSAPISAFGFLAPPAPVIFEGSFLGAGTGFHVIAGNILLDNGATLFQPGGAVTLFSAGSAGEVPFSLSEPGAGFASATTPTFRNITLQNGSFVALVGATGGKVVIRGGHMVVDNSVVTTGNSGPVVGPSIAVQVNQLTVQNNGSITSAATGTGHGGNIQVQADAVSIQGTGGGLTGIASSANGMGQSGDVSIAVTGGLDVTQGGIIGVSTGGMGPGGDMVIQAGSVTVADAAISLASEADGRAGTLTMTVTGALTLIGFGFIDATAFAGGNAGDIAIHAGSVLIDGFTAPAFNNPGIFAQSQGMGNAGIVNVNVDGTLTIVSSGQISGTTSTSGHGGEVSVHAGTLQIDGSLRPDALTGIVSTTKSHLPMAGDGGFVEISVDGALVLSGHAEISSGTESTAPSGDVTVNAGALTILGGIGAGNPSGIYAQTTSSGHAGQLTINVAGALSISGLGEIDTSTFSTGRAGDVIVTAQTLSINGTGSPAGLSGILSSGTFISSAPAGSVNVGVAGALELADGAVISSANTGSGPGGDVVVSGGNISLAGASTISASATTGDAGNVAIQASDAVTLADDSSIDTSAGANGGNITMHVGKLVYLFKSRFTAQAHDNGGNIFIDPQFVVLNQSQITANAALGQGGNITIITDNFLTFESSITATGSTNGTIFISSPNVDLSGSLIALQGALVTDETRLRETCARSVNHEFSTFIMTGRGGSEIGPDELQSDSGTPPDQLVP